MVVIFVLVIIVVIIVCFTIVVVVAVVYVVSDLVVVVVVRDVCAQYLEKVTAANPSPALSPMPGVLWRISSPSI